MSDKDEKTEASVVDLDEARIRVERERAHDMAEKIVREQMQAALNDDGFTTEEERYWAEREDGIAVHALGMASAYAAHRPDGQTAEQVVDRANAYLAFLRGEHVGTVQ